MEFFELATCDVEIAAGVPEWVHLLPSGKMTGRDGRSFDASDVNMIIQSFKSRGIDLPIDYHHQNDKPEAKLSGRI